jgi:hypothetical protein
VYLIWGLPGGWFYLSRRRLEKMKAP